MTTRLRTLTSLPVLTAIALGSPACSSTDGQIADPTVDPGPTLAQTQQKLTASARIRLHFITLHGKNPNGTFPPHEDPNRTNWTTAINAMLDGTQSEPYGLRKVFAPIGIEFEYNPV